MQLLGSCQIAVRYLLGSCQVSNQLASSQQAVHKQLASSQQAVSKQLVSNSQLDKKTKNKQLTNKIWTYRAAIHSYKESKVSFAILISWSRQQGSCKVGVRQLLDRCQVAIRLLLVSHTQVAISQHQAADRLLLGQQAVSKQLASTQKTVSKQLASSQQAVSKQLAGRKKMSRSSGLFYHCAVQRFEIRYKLSL